MSPERHVPEQLDVPLVWEIDASPAVLPRDDDPFPQPRRSIPVEGRRLLLAALTDAGVVIACIGCCWVAAAARGAELNPQQLFLAALFGLEVAGVVALAGLMGARATPGMLLTSVEMADPIPLSRAVGLWTAWLAALPLLGLPLIVGRRGGRLLERLAAAPAILRPRSSVA